PLAPSAILVVSTVGARSSRTGTMMTGSARIGLASRSASFSALALMSQGQMRSFIIDLRPLKPGYTVIPVMSIHGWLAVRSFTGARPGPNGDFPRFPFARTGHSYQASREIGFLV